MLDRNPSNFPPPAQRAMEPQQEETDPLLRYQLLARRMLRHAGKGLLIGLFGVSLSLAAALLFQRVYESEVVLLYRQLIDDRMLGGERRRASPRDVGMRLREFLLARPNLAAVRAEFGLYADVVARRGEAVALEKMRKQIDFRVRAGDTFHIAFCGHDPATVQRVTARLAELVIVRADKLRGQQASTTFSFIEAERRRAQSQLQAKEKELAQFLARHPEFAHVTMPGENGAGASIRAQEAARRRSGARRSAAHRRSDPAVMALRRQAARIRGRLANRTSSQVKVPRLEAAREAAEGEVREARQRLGRVRARYTDRHPDVVAAKGRLRAARARLKRVQQTLARATALAAAKRKADRRQQRRGLQQQLSRLEGQIAQRRAARRTRQPRRTPRAKKGDDAQRVVALETEWARLSREIVKARERYLQLEDRQFRASLAASSAAAGRTAKIEVIDPAFRPTRPASVGRTTVALAGVGTTFALTLLVLLGLALRDDRVLHASELSAVGPLVVEIPAQPRKRRGRG